jgi:GTPase
LNSFLIVMFKYLLTCFVGEAIYEIGVADSGELLGLTEQELNQSFATLQRMAAAITAEATSVMFSCCVLVISVDGALVFSRVAHREGTKGACLQALVRELRTEEYIDVRVAVAGNVDSGKSTLIGVLVKGALDDGRGSMRQNVFNHRHEVLLFRYN